MMTVKAVIDSFSCTSSKDANLHLDCTRLALFDTTTWGDSSEVAKRYGKTRQTIHARVKKIRKAVSSQGFVPIVLPKDKTVKDSFVAIDYLLNQGPDL